MNNQTINVIRRPSRLGAVWLSYRTRWLMWIMAAVAFGPLFLLVRGLWPNLLGSMVVVSPEGHVLKSAEPSMPNPSPFAEVDSNQGDGKTDWANVRSLDVMDLNHSRRLLEKGAVPKLESLAIRFSVTDLQLAQLCELYDLKSLTLYDSSLLTPTGLKAWKNETSLKYLRLLNCRLAYDPRSLDWPTNLQTLICDDPYGIKVVRLEEWQQLANLTCLSTRLIPREDGLNPGVVESLKRFPVLTRLFVQELGPQYPHLVSDLQSALPNLRVRPNSYDPAIGLRAGTILVCGLLVLVVMSVQMSSQFSTTASLLMPGFARSHLTPIIAAMLLMALLSFGLDLIAGCSVVGSLGLCGAFVLILASGTRVVRYLISQNGTPMPGFNNPQAIFAIVFPPMGLQFLINYCGSELDWFLRGQLPWLSVALLVGSILGAFDLLRWHIGLKRELEESGGGDVPLGMLDYGGWYNWGKELVALREGEGKRPRLILRRSDSRRERSLEQIQSGKSVTSLMLWRLGSASNTLDWLHTVIAILIVFGVAGAWLIPDVWSQFGNIAAFGGLQVIAAGLVMPLAFAWQRRPMQEMELLRPVTRRDWIATWFRGVASEMLPVLLVAIPFVAGVLWSGAWGSWSVVQAALAIIIFVGALTIVFAVGMWILTLHALWQKLLIGFATYFVVVACVIMPIVIQYGKINWQAPTILVQIIAGLYLTAGVGLWVAYRSWMNWEVGRSA